MHTVHIIYVPSQHAATPTQHTCHVSSFLECMHNQKRTTSMFSRRVTTISGSVSKSKPNNFSHIKRSAFLLPTTYRHPSMATYNVQSVEYEASLCFPFPMRFVSRRINRRQVVSPFPTINKDSLSPSRIKSDWPLLLLNRSTPLYPSKKNTSFLTGG